MLPVEISTIMFFMSISAFTWDRSTKKQTWKWVNWTRWPEKLRYFWIEIQTHCHTQKDFPEKFNIGIFCTGKVVNFAISWGGTFAVSAYPEASECGPHTGHSRVQDQVRRGLHQSCPSPQAGGGQLRFDGVTVQDGSKVQAFYVTFFEK